MGQLYHSAAFFSYPITMYFKPVLAVPSAPAPHVEGVVQARKKKVWVHGLMQRVHPRLVGSSRENMNMTENMNTRTHLDSDNKWIHIWPPKRPHPHKCL